jgi:predicted TIM-barrel fold metal-dependent hydrolase
MLRERPVSRRDLLRGAAGAACAVASTGILGAAGARAAGAAATSPAGATATTRLSDHRNPAEPIIDIHQHTPYSKRPEPALLHHQRRMGITRTILLPAGSPAIRASTLNGRANGLQAGAGTYDACIKVCREHPDEYACGANEVPDLPGAHDRIERELAAGAVVIGEQKFNLPVESPQMERIYAIAQEHGVPVLLHFQYEYFNTGYERFGKVLAKWPKVTFIGHAQTFWANIDAKYDNQKVMYPKGKVTPGGLTDRYLSDHANFYGDLSGGSGLNAFIRDEEHARGFIERHQDRLMYGSDCSDSAGFGPTCSGANQIAAVRRLSPNKPVERKLLYENAKALFKIS